MDHTGESSDVDEGEWIWESGVQSRDLVQRRVARSSKNETSEDRGDRIRERGAEQFEGAHKNE